MQTIIRCNRHDVQRRGLSSLLRAQGKVSGQLKVFFYDTEAGVRDVGPVVIPARASRQACLPLWNLPCLCRECVHSILPDVRTVVMYRLACILNSWRSNDVRRGAAGYILHGMLSMIGIVDR